MKKGGIFGLLTLLVLSSLLISISGCEYTGNTFKELFIQKTLDDQKESEKKSPEKQENQEEIPIQNPEEMITTSNDCTEEPIPGKIYVKFKQDYDVSTKQKLFSLTEELKSEDPTLATIKDTKQKFPLSNSEERKKIQKRIGLNRWVEIQIDPSLDVLEESKKWLIKTEVEEVDIEREPCLLLYPNEYGNSRFEGQWYHENIGYGHLSVNTTPDADMDSVEAWDLETGAGITVAAPDTSVFWHHEDLVDNIWQNLGEDADGDGKVIQPNGTEYIYRVYQDFPEEGVNTTINRSYTKYIFDPDDINGIDDDDWDNDPTTYIDDFIGWDISSNDNDPNYDDSDSDTYQWHGTQTSSAITATGNNSKGIAGICWNCKAIAFRMAVGRSAGIYYSVENGARVISMSWMNSYSGLMEDALDYAFESGVVLFAGAGNYGHTNNWFNGLCDNERVVCVTGTTAWDTAWGQTSYGPNSDVGAPSAVMIEATPYNHPLNIYVYSSGTSIGSPTAAGIGALILSKNPNLSPYEVISILQSSTDPIVSPPAGKFVGTGRVNAHKALLLTNRTLVTNGHFPKAIISSEDSTQLGNKLQLMGTANSTNLSYVEIWRSSGNAYPDNWELAINITNPNPVEEGLIYEVDLYGLPAGSGQFKLVVSDIYGQTAWDAFTFGNYYGCTTGQTHPCGSGVCSGVRTCISEDTWGNCSTFEDDIGICTECDKNGAIVYDPTQDIDCSDSSDCTIDTCVGMGECHNDYSSCECEFNENCTDSIVEGSDYCEEDQVIHNITTTNYTCEIGYCQPDGEIIVQEIVENCSLNGEFCEEGICMEEEINETNQTISLSIGWNLVALRLNNISYFSSDLNSLFVMKYSYGNWELDTQGNNPFLLQPLRAYYVYSTQNKTINFTGIKLNNTQKYDLINNTWNLFAVNNTGTYSTLYPDDSLDTFSLYETDGISHIEIANFNLPLDPTKYYWANLDSPELSPPQKTFPF